MLKVFTLHSVRYQKRNGLVTEARTQCRKKRLNKVGGLVTQQRRGCRFADGRATHGIGISEWVHVGIKQC